MCREARPLESDPGCDTEQVPGPSLQIGCCCPLWGCLSVL